MDETSSIDVSARGYRGGGRDGNTSCNGITIGGLFGAASRSGGSYGGYGGIYDGTGSNAPYGQPSEAIYLGSGGSCGDYGRIGGNGGGLINITASEALVVNGGILANGGAGSTDQNPGGGSGGSISINTSLLQGLGTIAANGGGYEVGGGGGRIAISYNYLGNSGQDLAGLRNINAFGGHGSHVWGSAGTVLFKKSGQQYGDLYVDDNMTNSTSSAWTPLTPLGFGKITDLTANTLTTDGAVKMAVNGLAGMEINPNLNQSETYKVISNTGTTITVDTTGKPDLTTPGVAGTGNTYAGIYRFDNVHFRRGGFLVMGDRLIVGDTMKIDEYGQLTHYDATMNFEPRLDLTVGTLEIIGNSSINVDARGYLGGSRGGNDCSGQTIGNVDGSLHRSGGSYGGLGGAWGGTPNGIYGSMTDPAGLGSGGSCGDYGRVGGDGGGWVAIHANSISLDGVISADGGTGSADQQPGSGSGGTINLVTSTLSGSGAIRANGGGNQVGGGGGRISLMYDGQLLIPRANISAAGGPGSYVAGSAGTIYPP
ncbi:MAG TPA: hypothetical protein DER40_01640 [Geobacter sp.]|nr:hypothetical protein [Geobacter sp.]